jgi:glycosyltransferase involved in cell wall biosynthesis
MNVRVPTKILITADTVGGVWTFATALARGLAAAGHDIYLLTLGPKPRDEQRASVNHRNVHLIPTDLALEWQDPAGDDVPEAQQFLRRLEHSIGPDVVHLNSYREACFDWRAPVLVTAHSCVFSWALACDDRAFLAEPQWRRYFEAVGGGLASAQAWVAPTRAFHRTISELYHPRTPSSVIWNGTAAAAASYDDRSEFILAAGRMWDRAKGLSLLAETAKGLDWPVLVAGSVDEFANAPPGIELLGPLSHHALRQRMQRGAIFASPSLYEPFGLSVLEAATSGCALVLSDIPTFRELWDGTAVFVDAGDAQALQRELHALTRDHQRRHELQRAAQARSAYYSLDDMVTAYKAIYSGLLPSAAQTTRRLAGARA